MNTFDTLTLETITVADVVEIIKTSLANCQVVSLSSDLREEITRVAEELLKISLERFWSGPVASYRTVDNYDTGAAVNVLDSDGIAVWKAETNKKLLAFQRLSDTVNGETALLTLTIELFQQKSLSQDAFNAEKANKYYNIVADYGHALSAEEAISYLTTAIQYNPRNAPSFFARGYLYERIKKYKLALEDYNEAIRLDDNNPQYHYFRASLIYDRYWESSLRTALLDLNQAIVLEQGKPEYYNLRGLCLLVEGDYGSALVDFRKASTTGSWNGVYYDNLLYCEEELRKAQLTKQK